MRRCPSCNTSTEVSFRIEPRTDVINGEEISYQIELFECGRCQIEWEP